MAMKPRYGAIEAGGTKFVCLVGTGPDDVRAETRIPTTTPERTIGQALDFLRAERDRHGPLAAVGIASFGPIDLHPRSPSYGAITSTPKPGWANTPIAGMVGRALDVPVGFDTDVNAAALAEGHWGAAQGLHSFIYLTIGTGIGGGGVLDGRVMHGLLHPEMGHIRVPHDRVRDPFAGSCPFHGDCLEGLASGPALAARWGQPGESLALNHEAWALEAHYLALALVSFVCTLSPQRIILGGGVMTNARLLPSIRAEVGTLLNNYLRVSEILEGIDRYIVSPGLGPRSGVLGALALARQAASADDRNSGASQGRGGRSP